MSISEDEIIKTAFDVLEIAAETAHEVNRAYCRGIGDNSQLSWEDAPEWQRISAINGANGVLEGNTPEQSHEGWLAEKRAAGWKYGVVKDPEKKEHPCFLPYSDLPEAQRFKDTLFVATVKGVLMHYGVFGTHRGMLVTGVFVPHELWSLRSKR